MTDSYWCYDHAQMCSHPWVDDGPWNWMDDEVESDPKNPLPRFGLPNGTGLVKRVGQTL